MKTPFTSNEYRVTSPYGDRVLNGERQYHAGIDLVCDNREVVATEDGTVLISNIVTDKNNLTWQWGNYICLLTNDKTKQLYYCHLDSRAVKQGDKVSKGDVLGIMGNTGYSFGAHLHLEVRDIKVRYQPTDAAEYLGIINEVGKAREKDMTKEQILNEIGDQFISTFDELPEWAKPDIRELLDRGIINGGTSSAENPNDINMFLSDIKTIIINKRMIQQ